MLKFIATNVVISKGRNDNPAFRFSEDGTSVLFRIGASVYDTRAEDNKRWVNVNVKAFGEKLCERIRKMKLNAGSVVHIEGRYDEDVWTDDGKTMRAPVIILADIEYAFSGDGKNKASGDGNTSSTAGSSESPQSAPGTQNQRSDLAAGSVSDMPENFTGFQNFAESSGDGENPFFPSG